MIIRSASPADYAAIEQITRDAFWDVYQPGCDEHYLVHLMHELSCFVPELDLVAEIDGEIVGHAICTQATLDGAVGNLANGSIKFKGTGELA